MTNEKFYELQDAMRKAVNDYFKEKSSDDYADVMTVDLTTKEELEKGITTQVVRRIKR